MRVRSSLKPVLAFAVVAYFGSAASAQQPSSPPPASTASGDAQVGFQRKTQLTTQELVAEANKHIARMEAAGVGVRGMLREARKLRDVVRALCLNDKVSQVDVSIRTGKDRRVQLEAAAKRNDAELSNHEFTIISVLRQRVEQLVAEANQCIGEEAAFVGDSRTRVFIDPNIAPNDSLYPPTDPSLVVTLPPQCTSCDL